MKNKILGLMLSAAIFTTHPAFCMENDEADEKSIQRTFQYFTELDMDVQLNVLSNLDVIGMESMAGVSKPYYQVLTERNMIKKIDLEIDFSDCLLGYMEEDSNFENIEFSLKMRMGQDKDNTFVSIRNFNFDSRKKICLPEKTNKLRKKIILFPLTGRLEFLLNAKSKDSQPIELDDTGYVKLNDQHNTKGPEKVKIANGSAFKIEIYIDQDPWMKCHFGNYRFFNIKERKRDIRNHDRKTIIRQLQSEMSKTFENIDLNNPIFKPVLAQAFSKLNLESSNED